jgi:glycine/D-amino acid oxidase-like deaminating enzyme
MSGLPHIHEMAPGVYSGLGYNGRGVGMATLMGQWLAELVTDGGQIQGMLPITMIKPIKLQSFRKPVITATYFLKSLQDRVEGRQKPI